MFILACWFCCADYGNVDLQRRDCKAPVVQAHGEEDADLREGEEGGRNRRESIATF